ncbi:MAG: chromate efflux transporter [Ahrensia sp.]|nr:chromate efflux transporter [Ahrensia sp.]
MIGNNERVSEAEAIRAFAKIGLLSFGGPAAQISIMHRILVDEKKWLSEAQFLHALNFCMLLPGPEAMQLSTYAGWLLHGVRGGLIAGLLFILPGLAMMLALSAIYVLFGNVPIIEGLLFGLKAAVLAVVAQALAKVAGRALKAPLMYGVAVAAFIGIALLKVPFPLIVIGAGVLGALIWVVAPALFGDAAPKPAENTQAQGFDHRASIRAAVIWGLAWAVPLGVLVVLFGSFESDAALFFSQTAIVTFGGAYAVLAWVGQQAVEAYNWLTPDAMLTGLGLAETTLGPLVLVLVFVGFVGGANAHEAMPLLGGLGGGLIAAFFTFVPCFLWIFVGAPYVEALRNVRWLAASLATITAAVVGVIANLAVWFGLHVLFGDYPEARFGPFYLPMPDVSQIDLAAFIIAISSAVALFRFKIGMLPVLGAAAVAGLVLRLF